MENGTPMTKYGVLLRAIRGETSLQEHAIPVRIEPIFLVHGVRVGLQHALPTGEG